MTGVTKPPLSNSEINARLKKMYAEERLKAEIVQEVLEKSGEAISTKTDGTTPQFRDQVAVDLQ